MVEPQDLSREQREGQLASNTSEEALEEVKNEEIDLSDEQLNQLAGGSTLRNSS